eukprot:scaffold3882_cov164-Amphora_coffeaeformis.AAC.20
MSEEMIKRQRAALLLQAGKGSRAATSSVNGGKATPTPVRQTPQQAAAAAMLTEDQLLDRFIQRLHQRDDSRPDAAGAPTVPTALSRRILAKQGVGYLDHTVGAVVSAAGDRFLATILHQATACRDERLKGAELIKNAARTRQRHWEQYEADVEHRRKRKLDLQEKDAEICHNAIKAAEALKKFPPANSASSASNANSNKAEGGETTPSSSKKKKKKADDSAANSNANNGSRLKLHTQGGGDEASVNSIDEEEAYHRDYFGDVVAVGKGNGNAIDDEEEDMLILRDLSRPMEAWGFHVTGKQGLQPAMERSEDSEDESDGEEEDSDADGAPGEDDMDEDDVADDDDDADEMDGKRTPIPKSMADKKKASPASDSKRKSAAPSPVPTPTPNSEATKD